MTSNQIKGFTLVELAIVLVIIGLITGGVLAGQSLIKASRISSVAAQLQKYQSAYNKYKDQYGAVPGDHSSAYDYWGSDCASTAAACNGDGNRQIVGSGTESLMFFRHLWLAEMIDEKLTGVNTDPDVIGTNVPTLALSAISLLPYAFQKLDYYLAGTSSGSYTSVTANILIMGKSNTNWFYSKALTPADAKKIDTKIDDGKPGTGGIIAGYARTSSGSGCADNAANTIAGMRASDYRVADTDEECTLGLILEEPV